LVGSKNIPLTQIKQLLSDLEPHIAKKFAELTRNLCIPYTDAHHQNKIIACMMAITITTPTKNNVSVI
jgi:hypothetical protein